MRQTSRARRAALKRQVLRLLKSTRPESWPLTDLRERVVGSNESVGVVLRALVQAGHVERVGYDYRITESGCEQLGRVAGLRAPRCGEYTARLREMLHHEVLDANQIALRLFGSTSVRDRGRARSLAHYVVRLGAAVVEDGVFGPPELRRPGSNGTVKEITGAVSHGSNAVRDCRGTE